MIPRGIFFLFAFTVYAHEYQAAESRLSNILQNPNDIRRLSEVKEVNEGTRGILRSFSGTIREYAKYEADHLLLAHNILRNIHQNTPNVTWNQDIADKAQSWAQYLADIQDLKHSPPGSEYRDAGVGENIFWALSDSAPAYEAVCMFYEEEYQSVYNYETGQSDTGGVVGHFTQVVWDDTIQIGCGVARQGGTYVVCQYSPSGNYVGTYTEHVHRPKPGIDPETVNEYQCYMLHRVVLE